MLKMTYQGEEPITSNVAFDVWVDAKKGTTAEVDDLFVEGLVAVGWTASSGSLGSALDRAAKAVAERDAQVEAQNAPSDAAPAVEHEDNA